jgi:hypothetical protein
MAAIICSGEVAAPSRVTRASFFIRSADTAFTPASLSKACFTSLSQPPQVMPVTENTNSLLSAMSSSSWSVGPVSFQEF